MERDALQALSGMLKQYDGILGKAFDADDKLKLFADLLLIFMPAEQYPHDSRDGRERVRRCITDLEKACAGEAKAAELQSLLRCAADKLSENLPQLRGVSLLNSGLDRLSEKQIRQLLGLFSEFHASDKETRTVDTADAYEYALGKFSVKSAKQSGRFYTPRQTAMLLARLLRPSGGSVYDPCCGTAGILMAAAEYMTERQSDFMLYGQEPDAEAWKSAKINLMLKELRADLGSGPSYALKDGMRGAAWADYVISNPPYADAGWRSCVEPESDIPLKYGKPPKNRGCLAWLQYMLYCLKDGGRMSVLLSTSVLASQNAIERRIRIGLVQDRLPEAIVLLPYGLFYNTKIPVSLWMLQKGDKKTDRDGILMVDASEMGKAEGGQTRLTTDEEQKLLDVYREYRRGALPEQENFCRTVRASEILEKDGALDPRKYIVYRRSEIPEEKELELRETELKREAERLIQMNTEVFGRISASVEKKAEAENVQ